jgi:hypothetical protein
MQLLAMHDVVAAVTSLQASTVPASSLFEFKLEHETFVTTFFNVIRATSRHTPTSRSFFSQSLYICNYAYMLKS